MLNPRRWPIVYRLTGAFLLAMLFVLATTTAFTYVSQGRGYRETTDDDLRARNQYAGSQESEGLTVDARQLARLLVDSSTGFMQVYDPNGEIYASSAVFDTSRVLPEDVVTRATRAGTFLDARAQQPDVGEVRVFLRRVDDDRMIVATIESTRDDREALDRLAMQLMLGDLVVLVLGTAIALWLTRGALRPVERLRAEADRASGRDADVVLHVPEAHDEIARLATTFNELLLRMRGATLREREFVAEAGHELRTPLATMQAQLELALERNPTPEVARTLGILLAETRRIASLASRLLQLSTERPPQVRDTPFDLHALVDVRVELARAVHPAARYELTAGNAAGAWRVAADADRMAQAIDNLLENAVVHGGSAIEVDLATVDGAVELHVRDDGAGIDAETAERAFQRFARAPDARTRPGAGLGLSIVRAIVQEAGGTCGIGARSDGVQGTDVWIRLPRA